MVAIRRSLAWMILSQGGLFVVQFGSSVVIARLLTPYDMGVFAIAAALVALLSTIRALGLGGYIVRAPEFTPSLRASAFTINAAIATLVSALIVLLSALGEMLLSEPGVRRLLLVMALLPLINIFEFLPATGIERHGNFRAIAMVNLSRTVVANIVMLGFAYSGFSYMSLAYGQIVGAIVSAATLNIVGWSHVSLRIQIKGCRDILKYGLQMLTISGVTTMASKMGELVLARILGIGALGLYSRASGLNSVLWDNVHLIVARIVFVDFSEQRRQGLSLRTSYLRIMQMMVGLLWPAFAGMAVIAGPLVLFLYGELWVAAAPPLSLLSISAMVAVSITMTWEVFVVSNETAQQVRIEFWRVGIGLLLFSVGALAGLAGAATGRVGETVLSVALYRRHLDRMTDTSMTDLAPIYWQGCVLTILAILPASLIMSIHSWSPYTPIVPILIGVVAGLVLWLFGLRGFRHPLYNEILLILSYLNAAFFYRFGKTSRNSK